MYALSISSKIRTSIIKRSSLLLLLLSTLTLVSAQELTPMKKGKLWGYVDESQQFIVQPTYTAVGTFMSGYAWVNKGGKVKYDEFVTGGKFGVINDKGEIVCPVEYDYVDLCFNNIVAVNKGCTFSEEEDILTGGLWGYYDLKNKKELISPQYNQVTAYYTDSIAWVQKGGNMVFKLRLDVEKEKEKVVDKTFIFNASPRYRLKSQFKKVNSSGKWALIDKNGKLLTEFNYTSVGDFRNGMAYVYNNGYGALNTKGELTVPCQYELISDCYEGGRFWAYQVDDGKNSKIGLIDTFNNPLTEFKYNVAMPFRQSVAWVTVGDMNAIVDMHGKELTEFKYKFHGPFSNGVAWVSDGNLFGLLNNQGVEIRPMDCYKTQLLFGFGSFVRFNKNNAAGDGHIGWVVGFPDDHHEEIDQSKIQSAAQRVQQEAKALKDGNDLEAATVEKLGMKYIWLDAQGNIVAITDNKNFTLDQIVPDGLWDY